MRGGRAEDVGFVAGAPTQGRERSDNRPQESLALLYQGFLTGSVRISAKRQVLGPPESFRRRMQIALKDVRRDAIAVGYSPEDVRDAEFAIVAFLDEVILSSDDPGRGEWAKQVLSVEVFQDAHAGEVFFERLESFRTRQDSPQLADVLEVYLQCMLLGFQGRYVKMPGELQTVIERTFRRIQGIRPPSPVLVPEALVTAQPQLPPPPPKDTWRWRILGAVAGCILLFVVLWLHLFLLSGGLNWQPGGQG